MKLYDQFSTMEKQAISQKLIQLLIHQAKESNDKRRVEDLEIIESTIFSVKIFNILANTLFDGIHIVDVNGFVAYANKGFTRATGFTEKIIGNHIDDLNELGYNSYIANEALRTKMPVNVKQFSSITKVEIITTATPVFYDDGSFLGIIIIDRDITELERLQTEIENSQKNLKMKEEEIINKEKTIAKLTGSNKDRLLIGESKPLIRVKELIAQIAPIDATVLITGETGTGKENIANEIYRQSNRKDKPFIKVNCSAIPNNLIESELFGYEKGAFTGANSYGKIGFFEMAQNGTILLDEIGEFPLDVQPKLLRVIQQKELLKIGSTKPIQLNVRIIAATNRNLYEMSTEGTFRMDLYYRLNLFPIEAPSLRERIYDIPLLVEYFLKIFNSKYGKKTHIANNAIQLLCDYNWPGNIRELQNILERIVIISQSNEEVSFEMINSILGIIHSKNFETAKPKYLVDKIQELEKSELIKALSGGKSTREAAKILGIDSSNVVRKIQKYGIKRE